MSHAFDLEPPDRFEPTKAQELVVDQVCREIVRRHLSTPALILLEISRPLNFLAAQAMHFVSPILSTITDARGQQLFAEFLESRGAVDYLCRRIEELESKAPSA